MISIWFVGATLAVARWALTKSYCLTGDRKGRPYEHELKIVHEVDTFRRGHGKTKTASENSEAVIGYTVIRWRVPPCWNEGILYRHVHGEEYRQQ